VSATNTLPEQQRVHDLLGQGPLRFVVDGKATASANGQTFPVYDPGTGEPVTDVYEATAEDVGRAVDAAKRAFDEKPWATLPANERSVFLQRLADCVEKHAREIAELESLDVGKPIAQAAWDVGNFSETVRYYADLALHSACKTPIPVAHHEARTVRLPRGVCGFIIPWNFPFLLLGWGISPALAAGNTVVIKPAEDTPLSTLYFMRLVEEAGIPEGVINVVTGTGSVTGAALARNPQLAHMSFTGSPEVGRLVARDCGHNLVPIKLVLGGKGAAVVFSDTDLDRTVSALVAAITLNSGQVCCTASRWLVEKKICDRFVDSAASRMKLLRVGYGRDPETEMGPVVSPKQRERVLGYLRKAQLEGAKPLLEGGVANVAGREKGYYVRPALLGGSPDNVACREEIFGPVPYIVEFRDEEEAIRIVNQSSYGLANSVWSSDLRRANRVAEKLIAGNSWINAHNVFVHGVPYGGVNLSGFGGGVLSSSTFFDYLRNLSVVRPL
jgi:aldehyde dehydrogenase (NAD+)